MAATIVRSDLASKLKNPKGATPLAIPRVGLPGAQKSSGGVVTPKTTPLPNATTPVVVKDTSTLSSSKVAPGGGKAPGSETKIPFPSKTPVPGAEKTPLPTNQPLPGKVGVPLPPKMPGPIDTVQTDPNAKPLPLELDPQTLEDLKQQEYAKDKNSWDFQSDDLWKSMQDEYKTGLDNTLKGTYADEAVMGRRAAEMNALGGGSGYGGSFNAAMAQTALGGEQLRADARQKAQEGHLNMEGAYLERLMSRAQNEDDQDFQAYLQSMIDSNQLERESIYINAQKDALDKTLAAATGSGGEDLGTSVGNFVDEAADTVGEDIANAPGISDVGNALKWGWNNTFGRFG